MKRTCSLFTHAAAAATALSFIGATLDTTVAAAQSPFDPHAYYSLLCRTGMKALDNGGTTKPSAQNTPVIQWPWLGTERNQAWQITSAPNNTPGGPVYSNLMSLTSGMSLVSPGGNQGGWNLFQYWAWWASGPNASDMPVEDWRIGAAPGASGYYNITSKANGMAVDNAGSQKQGTAVIQWPLLNNTNQQWQPVPLYSWAAITVNTGGDDLRGGSGLADSWLNITLTINGVQQTFTDVSQNQNWSNNSTHTVYVQLNSPVSYIISGNVQLTLGQWYSGLISADDWDLQGLNVTLYSTDPDPTNANPYGANSYANMRTRGYLEASKWVFNGSGGSAWQRLTPGNPTVTFAFNCLPGR
jgi:hypothetical protein